MLLLLPLDEKSADVLRDKLLGLCSDDNRSLSSRVKFMIGMGVVLDPGVLVDLGNVVNLQESTGSVP